MNLKLLRHIAAPAALLIAVMYISYGTPRENKYVSTNILEKIALPIDAGDWHGVDIDEKLNLGEGYYSYLGSLKTRKYTNGKGDSIFLTLMDAGNFHHPKLCFQGAGYTPEEMPDTPIETVKSHFTAPTIFFKKRGMNTLVLYWLCLDKQRVGWGGQKAQDLWNSIIGKKRIGLIVRLDIVIPQSRIVSSTLAAQDLIKSISAVMPADQAEYIFGK